MRFGLLLSLATAGLVTAGAAQAQQMVLGKTLQASCYERALYENSSFDALRLCDEAVARANETMQDRAATYINRGIIRLRRDRLDDAMTDFDTALQLDPQMGDAYINQAAVYLRQSRYDDALKAIGIGLTLELERPQAAYFNRAIAHEMAGDIESAYYDYQRAAELDPEWELPRTELQRFQVVGTG